MAAFSALVEASTLLWESIQGVSGKDTEIGNHKGYKMKIHARTK